MLQKGRERGKEREREGGRKGEGEKSFRDDYIYNIFIQGISSIIYSNVVQSDSY